MRERKADILLGEARTASGERKDGDDGQHINVARCDGEEHDVVHAYACAFAGASTGRDRSTSVSAWCAHVYMRRPTRHTRPADACVRGRMWRRGHVTRGTRRGRAGPAERVHQSHPVLASVGSPVAEEGRTREGLRSGRHGADPARCASMRQRRRYSPPRSLSPPPRAETAHRAPELTEHVPFRARAFRDALQPCIQISSGLRARS